MLKENATSFESSSSIVKIGHFSNNFSPFAFSILMTLSSPQLIKDCNANVQRMKSTEELIHLSQNMEFECKVKKYIYPARNLF